MSIYLYITNKHLINITNKLTTQDNQIITAMVTVAQKRKRSEKLSKELYRGFAKYVRRFDNYEEAAEDLGVHKNTISRILKEKSCETATRIKIENKLKAA
jgi:hypothetical protein